MRRAVAREVAGDRTYASPFEQRMAMTASAIHIGNERVRGVSEKMRYEKKFNSGVRQGTTSETALSNQALNRMKNVMSQTSIHLGEHQGSYSTSSGSVHTCQPNENAGRVTRGYAQKWKQLDSCIKVGSDRLGYLTTDEHHNRLGTSLRVAKVPREQLLKMKHSGELASNFKFTLDSPQKLTTATSEQFQMTNEGTSQYYKQLAKEESEGSRISTSSQKMACEAGNIPRGNENLDYHTQASIGMDRGRLTRTGETLVQSPSYTFHSQNTNKFTGSKIALGYD